MGIPSFESNIKNSWAVTQNNNVGRDERGTVAKTGVNELVITTIPVNLGGQDRESLQDFINYAVSNGNDLITFQLDHVFNEQNIVDLQGIDIQADDGYTVDVKLKYNLIADGSEIIGIKIICNYEEGFFGNTLNIGTSGSGNGQLDDPYDVCVDEFNTLGVVVANRGNTRVEIFDKDGTYSANFSPSSYPDTLDCSINISDYPIYVGMAATGMIVAYDGAGSTGTVSFGGLGSGDGLFQTGGIWQLRLDPVTDDVYVYDHIADRLQQFDYSGLFVDKWAHSDLFEDVTGSTAITSFCINENFIYFLVKDARHNLYKYKKETMELLDTVDFKGTSYGELQAFKDININKNDGLIYVRGTVFGSPNTIVKYLVFDSKLDFQREFNLSPEYGGYALKFGTTDVDGKLYFCDVTTDTVRVFEQYDLDDRGSIEGDYTTSIKYCNIEGNNLNAFGGTGVTGITNSIIKSDKGGIHSLNPTGTMTNACQYNIFHVNGWALQFIDGGSTSAFNFTFKNNTIQSTKGISIYGTDSNFVCKNNILACTNAAIYLNNVVTSFTISNSLVNGTVTSITTYEPVLTNCIESVSPFFKSIIGEDFHLQSIAEDYSVDSPAIGIGDDSNDAGCYNMTYINNGELNTVGMEILGFEVDIDPKWKFTQKEIVEDYTGNILKYMGYRRRVLTLEEQKGTMMLRTLMRLQKLLIEKTPLRFFPNGNDGIYFAILTEVTNDTDKKRTILENYYFHYPVDEVDLVFNILGTPIEINGEEYDYTLTIPETTITGDITSGSDIIDNIASTAGIEIGTIIKAEDYLPKDTQIRKIIDSNSIQVSNKAMSTSAGETLTLQSYYFLDGFLRGFYVSIDDTGTLRNMRIDENNETTLYLKNSELLGTLPTTSTTYTCKVYYIYVTFGDEPNIVANLWNNKNQTGDLKKLELHELEDKFEVQI
jgi:hypothetical protein